MTDYSKIIASLSPEKRALLELRLRQKGSQYNSFPVSYSQKRMWFLDQLEPGNPIYNLPSAIRLKGELNITVLEKSINEIICRHESLRTTFTTVNGQPFQLVSPKLIIELPVIDLQNISGNEKERVVEQLAREEARRPFDLSKGPLVRTSLFQLSPDEFVVLFNMHHIISDGWSIGVLIREIGILYEAFLNDKPSPFPPLPLQYADYARWQQQFLDGEMMQQQLAYWKMQLGDNSHVLKLPTDRPRPSLQSSHGSDETYFISTDMTSKLNDLSKREGTTLFMTLLAVFQTLLYRYTGQNDISVGTPIANRTRAKTENLIGYFINTLVLRTDLSDNPSFRDLLGRVKEMTLEAYANQDLPFEKLVEAIQPERDMAYTPLFQVMFILQNTPPQVMRLPGLTISRLEIKSETAEFDLTMSIAEVQDRLRIDLQYNSDLFEATTIERMLNHYRNLLESVVDNPDKRIADLPLMAQTERQQILVDWNRTKVIFPADRCIHQLFEDQVMRAPKAVAVISDQQELTYHELNFRANQLARYLEKKGIGAEKLVGISVDRSWEMIVGLMGILKAGAAYLPLDPNYPTERLAFMIEDSRVSTLLTQEHLVDSFSSHQLEIICLDRDWNQIALENGENFTTDVTPQNLAYVIYTSGSTGQPKGVLVTHQSVVNHNLAVIKKFEIRPSDRMLQFASLNFDGAVEEIFPTLLSGATIVLRSGDGVLPSYTELLNLITDQRLTILDFPTVYWHEWVYEIMLMKEQIPPSLRLVIVGGDKASPERFVNWQQIVNSNVRWLNTYGPTESTVISTAFDPEGDSRWQKGIDLPIGRPIDNTQIYILDLQLQPVPIGVPGELLIGGVGLARGYLDRPDLTAERFIPDPFSEEPGARLYRTGDLVRYLPDGNIEFIGRVDFQVKVRGFRVELGEIEAVLAQHPSLKEWIVVVREDTAGDKRIVAYYVPHQDRNVTTSELREFVDNKLPDYMMPSAFVSLDSLPKTPNGKVDRRALPLPDYIQFDRVNTFVAPRTPIEELIADLWRQILKIPKVSIYDNFFELGGHSLLATQLNSRLRDAFKVDIPLRLIFETPSVAVLAQQVEMISLTSRGLQIPPMKRVPRDQEMPLSFAQQRLWFLDQLEPNNPEYNVPDAVRLSGKLNIMALRQSIHEIVRRHEILRTTFETIDGKPFQKINDSLDISLPIIDLQEVPEPMQETFAKSILISEAKRPFRLDTGPLLRTTLFRLNEEDHIILLVMHHIISDGWSTNVLIKEVAALYDSFSNSNPSPLPELQYQYADFAHWQRTWLYDEVLQTEIAYWKQQLANSPALLELPTDYPRPAVQTTHGAHQTFKLTPELSKAVADLSRQEGVTLFMTLLGAFQTLLARYSGQDIINVGTPIANRNRSETESLIGFFVNTLVFRTDLSDNPSFLKLLSRVKKMTLEAYAHQDVPFEKIVDAIQPERDLSHTPLFQVMFTLQNMPRQALNLKDLTLSAIELDTGISNFDLTLSISETDEGLGGALEYNTDLFKPATIARIIDHFQILLEAIVKAPDRPISALQIMTETELRQIIHDWNITEADFPLDQCIHQLIEIQVARKPDALAVIAESEQITYLEFNQRANQLAHYLRKQGITPEGLVGICVKRSVEMIVGLLGILKAGAAYLPLDPDYPKERLEYMIQDSQVSLILTQQALLHTIPADQTELLCLDADWAKISQEPNDNLDNIAQSLNQAYVIYTSGSTGQPKGVQVAHQSVVNHNLAVVELFGLRPDDRILQFATINFDTAVEEIFPALMSGAAIVLRKPDDIILTGEELIRMIETHQLTVLDLPTAYWQEWVYEMTLTKKQLPDSLRLVVVGGDKAAAEKYIVWKRIAGFKIRWLNTYGPTEGTVIAAAYDPEDRELPYEEGTEMPIGRPIANGTLRILDPYLQPVPVGVPGELYIGGRCVARGYLNRPDLTAEKFTPDPFSDSEGARLYRTGDRARYLPGGNIEFIGRVDHQVKVRGFRVELGEIETMLCQHPSVREAVVIAKEDSPGNKRLVAYCALSQIENNEKNNKRRHERVPFFSEVSIDYNGIRDARTKMTELSQSGARLLTIAPIPNWNEIQRIRMGLNLPAASQKIEIDSDLVWYHDGQFGVEFKDLSDETLSSIRQLMAQLKKEDRDPQVKMLRDFLKKKLPDYMMPSAFLIMAELPKTPSGKVDRKALPEPVSGHRLDDDMMGAPRTVTEKKLVDIWKQVLGIEQVGVDDNFFELGGDSILSIQVIARANRAGIQLTPKQLFENPTIAGLASAAGLGQAIQAEQGVITGKVPLTPIQRWFFEQNLPDPNHWNQAILLEVKQYLNPELLKQALKQLLVHHDNFRLRFEQTDEGWQQFIAEIDQIVPFIHVDLSNIPEPEHKQAIENIAMSVQSSLNIIQGPLLRVVLFDFGEKKAGRLLIVIHHLTIDGVSWRILFEDLQTTYQQLNENRAIQLPPKTTSFQYWAERLTEYAQDRVVRDEMDYWLAISKQQIVSLPRDFVDGINSEGSARTILITLDEKETTALLQEIPSIYRTQINDVLLTALVQAFSKWTGFRKLLIELEGHGREDLFKDVDLSHTIGWFTSIYPLVLDLGRSWSIGDALKTIKEEMRQIPHHGIGFGLLRYLNQDEGIVDRFRALPQPEVIFNYLGQFDRVLPEATPFDAAGESAGPDHGLKGLRSHLIEINGSVAGGKLQLDLTYSENIHRRETIDTIAHDFLESLRSIIAHCRSAEAGGITPSDFSLVNLKQKDLNNILNRLNKKEKKALV